MQFVELELGVVEFAPWCLACGQGTQFRQRLVATHGAQHHHGVGSLPTCLDGCISERAPKQPCQPVIDWLPRVRWLARNGLQAGVVKVLKQPQTLIIESFNLVRVEPLCDVPGQRKSLFGEYDPASLPNESSAH